MKTILNLLISFFIVILLFLIGYIYYVNTGRVKNILALNLKRGLEKIKIFDDNLITSNNSDTDKIKGNEVYKELPKLSEIINQKAIVENFKNRYFAKILVNEKDILLDYNIPVINKKFLIIPNDWINKIVGNIEISGASENYKVIVKDEYRGYAILEILYKTPKNYEESMFKELDKIEESAIAKPLEIIGFRNNLAYYQTLISNEITNEFDYKYFGNYLIQQNFDKNLQYMAFIDNQIVGVVFNGIFFTNDYLKTIIDYHQKNNESVVIMKFDIKLQENNAIIILKGAIIRENLIVDNINGCKIYNINQFKNLLFELLIQNQKIVINNKIDVSGYIDNTVSLFRFTDFECSNVNYLDRGGVKINDIKPESILARFGVKPGDIILKINDIDVSSRNQLIELFYYYNLKVKSFEIKTNDNIILVIKL
ncbi:MAG TPA: PDZ domain-containing protein [bacterium]|nr:PDZ domain-containing protein [bacterium]